MLERTSSALEVIPCSVVTAEYKAKRPALPVKGRGLVSVWSILGLNVPFCSFGTMKVALKKAGARLVRNFAVSLSLNLPTWRFNFPTYSNSYIDCESRGVCVNLCQRRCNRRQLRHNEH